MKTRKSSHTDARDLQHEVMTDALEASTVHEFRKRVFAMLDRVIGYDLVTMQSMGPDQVFVATSRGWETSAARIDENLRYSREFEEWFPVAMTGLLRLPDDLPSGAPWRHSRFFNEQFAPHGARTGCLRGWRTRIGIGCIIIGRTGASLREREMRMLETLVPAIAANDALFSAERAQLVSPRTNEPKLDGFGLSAREKEIGALVVRGLTNPEIASVLGTSPFTVRNQLAAIFEKCDVTSRAELTYQLLGSPSEPRVDLNGDSPIVQVIEAATRLETEQELTTRSS